MVFHLIPVMPWWFQNVTFVTSLICLILNRKVSGLSYRLCVPTSMSSTHLPDITSASTLDKARVRQWIMRICTLFRVIRATFLILVAV